MNGEQRARYQSTIHRSLKLWTKDTRIRSEKSSGSARFSPLAAMRAVLQRVHKASVSAAGEESGSIGPGILAFVGIHQSDTMEDVEWLSAKIPVVRIFSDGEGMMNRSVIDCGGEVLVISQFTLFGNLRKGTRPSFNRAAVPELAIPLYESFLEKLARNLQKPIQSGKFGAMMEIDAVNDGPVTLLLDTKDKRY